MTLYGYSLSTSAGVFILITIVAIYLLSLIGRVVHATLSAPKTIGRSLEKRHHRIGMQSLTYGLSAVAAGDIKAASYYTKRAHDLLKDDYGLVALLSGLTARLKGDEKEAEKSFQKLLKRDETAFLGIRGLLQTTMDRGDTRYARILARKAYAAHPHQPWIVKTLYGLELKNRDMDAAQKLLDQAQKINALSINNVRIDRAAFALYAKDPAKAYKIAPEFLPAILAILKDWGIREKRRKSLALIKKAWATQPHPDLIEYWISLAPKKAQGNAQRMIQWIEDLNQINPDNADANIYCADIALRFDYTAQANRFLMKAIDLHPTMRAYQLLSHLDPQGGWQDLMVKAHADTAWMCDMTGEIYPDWRAFNAAGDFNTLRWIRPDENRKLSKTSSTHATPFFITDVKAA